MTISERDYRALKAVSYTVFIKPIVKHTPAHSLWLQTHASADTASRGYLGAVHCLALTFDQFDDEYVVCHIRRDKRTKAYQAFLAEAGDRTVLTAKEDAQARATAEAIRNHPRVSEALAGDHLAEQSYVVQSCALGTCKGRVDLIWFDHANKVVWFIDLKSWKTNVAKRVAEDITREAWGVQLAWYEMLAAMSGAIPEGYTTKRVTLIACEGSGDYAGMVQVGWHEHTPAMCAVADQRLSDALGTIIECRESGVWPGQYNESQADPSKWAVLAAGLDPEELLNLPTIP